MTHFTESKRGHVEGGGGSVGSHFGLGASSLSYLVLSGEQRGETTRVQIV